MRRRKKSKAPQEPMQLSMDFDGTSIMEDEPKETIAVDTQERDLFNELTGKSSSTKIVKVSIPVESTFDVSQGLREAKSIWEEHRTQMEVEFDCRHLELVNAYVSSRELTIFEPQE